jgi:hypothetical protein
MEKFVILQSLLKVDVKLQQKWSLHHGQKEKWR